jgi:hypothetical protein
VASAPLGESVSRKTSSRIRDRRHSIWLGRHKRTAGRTSSHARTKTARRQAGVLSVLVGLIGEEVDVTVALESEHGTAMIFTTGGTLAPAEPDGVFNPAVAGEPAMFGFEQHASRIYLEPGSFTAAWASGAQAARARGERGDCAEDV